MSKDLNIDKNGSPDVSKTVAIIGAGMGGLTTAIMLKTKLNFHNFSLYERASGLGGTWWANTYPGCACDIPIHAYTLSTDPDPGWSSPFAFQPDILAYWTRVSRKYGVDRHIIYESEVVSAQWDAIENIWDFLVKNTVTGSLMAQRAHVLITAIGILDIPKLPDVPGLSDFQGDAFHSARWNHKVSLEGKRVTVIGNGCSATQFLPHIVKLPNIKVTQLCRTPAWFLPEQVNKPHSVFKRWMYRNIPATMAAERYFENFWRTRFFYYVLRFGELRKFAQEGLHKQLLEKLPERYREVMIPDYPLGCKRVVFDSGYLDALHKPNLEVKFDPIDRVVEDGIITKRGQKIPSDVIIFGTGFNVDGFPIHVKGLNGTVQEYYDTRQGPTAYRSTTIPGFPNFCHVMGPNVVPNSSAIIFEEWQVNYIKQLIAPVLSGAIASFDVKAEATDLYNKDIQARMQKLVLVQCTSFYRHEGTGKVTKLFPGTVESLRRALLEPIWDDYHVNGAKDGVVLKNKKKRTQMMVLKCLVFVIAGFYVGWALGWWSCDVLPKTLSRVCAIGTMAA